MVLLSARMAAADPPAGTETMMTPPLPPGTDTRRGQSHRAGFTMIEVIVVMVLLAVLAAVAAPRIDRVDLQLKTAARELVTQLSAAKHMAVLKQHDVVLGFDVSGRRIRVHSDRNSDRSMDGGEDVRFYELPDAVGFGKGGAPSIGAFTGTINLSQLQSGMPSLTFHRNGAASQETLFYFTSLRAARSGGFAEHARAVGVARATGTIGCRSYATSTWRRGC